MITPQLACLFKNKDHVEMILIACVQYRYDCSFRAGSSRVMGEKNNEFFSLSIKKGWSCQPIF
jgi:hypothetical protein